MGANECVTVIKVLTVLMFAGGIFLFIYAFRLLEKQDEFPNDTSESQDAKEAFVNQETGFT